VALPDIMCNRGSAIVRLRLPAQPVDATLFKLLIGQRFPVENRNVRLYRIRAKQGVVRLELTLAKDFSS
jgi:hypothetical protein